MTELNLAGYNSIPRVASMALSPDGRRVILVVQTLNADSTRFVSSLWEVPADGSKAPRRLTFSDKGESSPAFLADGSLLFVSGRTDMTVKEDEAESRLWLLPAGGGEARSILSVPGGIRALAVARDADTAVIRVQMFPATPGISEDADKGKKRKDAAVSAVLYDTFPIRYWDHDRGPRWSRLLKLSAVATAERPAPEDIAGDPVNSLEEASVAISPDGETVVSAWSRELDHGFRSSDLIAISGGTRRTLATGQYEFGLPQISPDGRRVVAIAEERGTPERATRRRLWLGDLSTGHGDVVAPEFDLWPDEPRWSADGSAVLFVADQELHRPIFRLDASTCEITRITTDGAFTSLCPDPSGDFVYALRTSWSAPLQAVRVGLDGAVAELPTPGFPLAVPGKVSSFTTKAADGTRIHSWLVLPKDASPEKPAPLVLWIHGGPFSSWNSWNWRWCPHLLVERGYAVLLPDPALSTGYGQAFLQRAWGIWGDVVLNDVFAALDAAVERPDIDQDHVAAMGGSFGGYMANWVAGHTDRFRAIVTHASLWSMAGFQSTTDEPDWWEYQFGSPYEHVERYDAASPDRSIENVRTPMLVIHGNLDYRVPISEALQLWTDLRRHDVPSQYLYFPDENHWVLKPGNALVWYETVLAFLDHHVRGLEWKRPGLV